MCIAAIAWKVFDNMPLVLISNRDEFLDRPTISEHHWSDLPIFAGRDELSGGTWLGFHQDTKSRNRTSTQKTIIQNGRWAIVLNFRDGATINSKDISRGQLVTDFLTTNSSPMDFAKQISLTNYAGFNLIVGNESQAVLINNRGYAPTSLHNGLHIISNGQPTEEWKKCERLRTRVYQELIPLIAQNISKDKWHKVAFNILSDTQLTSDDKLPNTGIPFNIEKALSSIFISHDRLNNYGTRTQSILTLTTADKNIKFDMRVCKAI